MRQDRKHSRFKDVPASPLQQARISTLAQNRLVNLSSPLFFNHVSFDQFTIDPHPETADRSVLGQWKMELAFQPTSSVINKRLFNRCASNLITNFDFDFVITNRQRHVSAINLGDQRTDRLFVTRTKESGQPLRLVVSSDKVSIAVDLEMPSLPGLDRGVGFIRFATYVYRQRSFGRASAREIRFASVQDHRMRIFDFDHTSWSGNQPITRCQFDRNSIRSISVGSNPVARL